MGRLTHETMINHFSHPHPLRLSSPSQNPHHSLTPVSCPACTSPVSSSWTYSCPPCQFHIHLPCSQLPPLIHHPSHPLHPLTLLPTPAYSEGCFNCDACSSNGSGFSYHCQPCGLDLHTSCASMPLSVSHYGHAHPLTLAFSSPYENKGFCCDVCGGMGGNHCWLYRCAMCEFDAHLSCGARQNSAGAQVRRSVSQPAMGDRSGRETVIGRAFSGIVEGAAQQFGQSFVQGIMGGGDQSGGGGSILGVASGILGSGQSDSGSSIFGVASGILGSGQSDSGSSILGVASGILGGLTDGN